MKKFHEEDSFLSEVAKYSFQTLLDVDKKAFDKIEKEILSEIESSKLKALFNGIYLLQKHLEETGKGQDVDRGDLIKWYALIESAPEGFVTKLRELSNPDSRYIFFQEAIRWSKGDEVNDEYFITIETAYRFKHLLKATSLSSDFTPDDFSLLLEAKDQSATLGDHSLEILEIFFALPNEISTTEFYYEAIVPLNALNLIYAVFNYVSIMPAGAVERFVRTYKIFSGKSGSTPDDVIISRLGLALFELNILRAKYGSPASFDLLGIGQIVGVIRDMLKDMRWLGKHEEDMAKLALKEKQLTLAETEIKIEREAIELANQKLDFILKIKNLELSNDAKNDIVSIVAPKILSVASSSLLLAYNPKSETNNE